MLKGPNNGKPVNEDEDPTGFVNAAVAAPTALNAGPPAPTALNAGPPAALAVNAGPPAPTALNAGPPAALAVNAGPPAALAVNAGPPAALAEIAENAENVAERAKGVLNGPVENRKEIINAAKKVAEEAIAVVEAESSNNGSNNNMGHAQAAIYGLPENLAAIKSLAENVLFVAGSLGNISKQTLKFGRNRVLKPVAAAGWGLLARACIGLKDGVFSLFAAETLDEQVDRINAQLEAARGNAADRYYARQAAIAAPPSPLPNASGTGLSSSFISSAPPPPPPPPAGSTTMYNSSKKPPPAPPYRPPAPPGSGFGFFSSTASGPATPGGYTPSSSSNSNNNNSGPRGVYPLGYGPPSSGATSGARFRKIEGYANINIAGQGTEGIPPHLRVGTPFVPITESGARTALPASAASTRGTRNRSRKELERSGVVKARLLNKSKVELLNMANAYKLTGYHNYTKDTLADAIIQAKIERGEIQRGGTRKKSHKNRNNTKRRK